MKSDWIIVPIVGAPGAGKYTIVSSLAAIYSSELRFTDTMVEEGPFAGEWTTAYVEIRKESLAYRVLCLPGGVPKEATLNLLRGAKRAVFVSDPQASWREWEMDLWISVKNLMPSGEWFYIINKLDLVRREDIETEIAESEEDAKNFLRGRGAYEDRPFIRICAIADDAKAQVEALFNEIIS